MRPLKLVLLLLPSTGQKGTLAFSRCSLTVRSSPPRTQESGRRCSNCVNRRALFEALTTRGGEGADLAGPNLLIACDQVPRSGVSKCLSSKPSDALSYYLLWSPTMRTKVILSGLFFGVLHVLAGSFLSTTAQKPSATGLVPNFVSNIVLPLLSSACCSIQLIINAFASAGGCAGFNSYLGPLRPYFVSFLIYLTFISRSRFSLKRWMIDTIFRLSLALLPEAVYFWNKYLTNRWTFKNKLSIDRVQPQGPLIEAQLRLDIPGMGCVACINKIDASIRSTAPQQIVSSESWLDPEREKGGNSSILLSVSSLDEAKVVAKSIVERIQGAGFDTCRVESIQVGSNAVPEV